MNELSQVIVGRRPTIPANAIAYISILADNMGQIYLKFKNDKVTGSSDGKPKTWLTKTFQKSVIKVLTAIIPKGNPDFEDKIDEVDEWLVELNSETEEPEREIGINNQGQTILIMPFGRNYGYWTDNNLKLNDFIELFQATPIEGKEFVERWNKFDHRNWG